MSTKFVQKLQKAGNCITIKITEIFLADVNAIFEEKPKNTIETSQVETNCQWQ